MDISSLIVRSAGVVALVLLNGFFVAAEFAIVKVRATQIELLSRKGTRRARIAQHITGHLDLYLSACQLGITMTSLGLGWVGEPFVAGLILPLLAPLGIQESPLVHTIAFAAAFSLITYIHIVLGEQAPKWYAIQYPRRSTLFVAGPLHLFTRIFRPFIWLLNASAKGFLRLAGINPQMEVEGVQSEEELRILLSRGKVMSGLGKAISLRAMELHDRSVREVMVPRTAVVVLSTERSLEENITIALENQFTRYPLCERDVDNVIGMIHLKDLFRLKGRQGPGTELLSIKREMLFIPESMPLERILTTFLARRVLMAIAVDEYGGTAGLVTLENVLEEVVGEIRDEFDEEAAPFHKLSDDEFLVDGAMALHDFSDMFEVEPDTRDVVTVSGYVIHRLGRVPERGAGVMLGEWKGTVEQVEGKMVKTVRIQRRGKTTQ